VAVGRGLGVAVGGTAVAVAVAVGGTSVGVAVGVAVGVGDTGVAVGGTVVAVGMAVNVGAGVAVGRMATKATTGCPLIPAANTWRANSATRATMRIVPPRLPRRCHAVRRLQIRAMCSYQKLT
jgi:hypothetical protein